MCTEGKVCECDVRKSAVQIVIANSEVRSLKSIRCEGEKLPKLISLSYKNNNNIPLPLSN